MTIPTREELKLKPYNIDYSKLLKLSSIYEKIDLTNLKEAAIRELSISNKLPFTQKFRQDIKELLSNPNIKRIKIEIDFDMRLLNKFFILIAQLLIKNKTIEEVEISCDYRHSNNIQIQVYLFFLNSISNLLVKTNSKKCVIIDDSISKLLYTNPNLREISIGQPEINQDIISIDYSKTKYTERLGNILCSIKHLDVFKVYDYIEPELLINNVKKSQNITEINTLIYEGLPLHSYTELINNAYLFKVENIICVYNNYNFDANNRMIEINQLLKPILQLSNNPLNTVKKVDISLRSNQINFIISCISKLIDSNEYNDEIPKLFLNYQNNEYEFEENKIVILDGSIQKLDFKLLKMCHDIYYSNLTKRCTFYFERSLYNNSFNEILFDDCLRILNSLPTYMEEFEIYFISSFLKQALIEFGIKKIINQMKNRQGKIKVNNQSKQIKSFIIYLTRYISEFNDIFFALLEIIINMNIKIENLKLGLKFHPWIDIYEEHKEIIKFMNKLKTIESLDINNIEIDIFSINTIEINSLDQYANLIKGKIKLNFRLGQNLDIANFIIMEILNSENRKNHNFLEFNSYVENNDLDNSISISIIKNSDYIKEIQKITPFYYKSNYLFRIIKILFIYLCEVSLEQIENLFSIYKKYKYFILNCTFYEYRLNNSDIIIENKSKIHRIYIETILDMKYREKLFVRFFSLNSTKKLSRKNTKYVRLHNIQYLVKKNI